MTCPFCSANMENFFLQSSHGIYLLPDPAPFGLPRLAIDKILLGGKQVKPIPVQYCRACQGVAFQTVQT